MIINIIKLQQTLSATTLNIRVVQVCFVLRITLAIQSKSRGPAKTIHSLNTIHLKRVPLKNDSAPCMLKNNIAISRLLPLSRFPIRFIIIISSSSSLLLPSIEDENQELCFAAAIFAFLFTSWAVFFPIKSSSSAAYLIWMDLNQFKLTCVKKPGYRHMRSGSEN